MDGIGCGFILSPNNPEYRRKLTLTAPYRMLAAKPSRQRIWREFDAWRDAAA